VISGRVLEEKLDFEIGDIGAYCGYSDEEGTGFGEGGSCFDGEGTDFDERCSCFDGDMSLDYC